jgi:integrase
MAGIRRRIGSDGKPRYQVIVKLRGRKPVYQTFRSKKLAKEWATRVEGEMLAGRLLPRQEAERHSLEEVVNSYLEDHEANLSAGEARKRRHQLGWWVNELGPITLASLSPGVIRDALSKKRRTVSGPTCNRYLAALSAALEVAVREWEWCETNPARSVRRFPEHRGRVRFLSGEERDALLEACRKSDDGRLYPLVIFALATGARQGELLNLKWSDVDLAKRRAVLHQTKNHDRRTLSFPGPAGDELRRLSRTPHISGYLFASPSGQTNFPKKAWEKALDEAGIEDFRFHDLRHTAASYLAMSGATLPELAAFLGHRTLAMVKRYAHLTEPHSEQVAARMVSRFLS